MQQLIELGSKLVFDAATGFVADKALEPLLEPAWAVVNSVLLPNRGARGMQFS